MDLKHRIFEKYDVISEIPKSESDKDELKTKPFVIIGFNLTTFNVYHSKKS